MSNKVTYLIGAGASANALPIVKEISARMQETLAFFVQQEMLLAADNTLSSSLYLDQTEESESHLENLRDFIKDFTEIIPLIADHASVDTYAKKLFLQKNESQLIRLKLIVSIFFTVLQAQEGGFDKRYDAYFASILNKLDEFPENIRIVSWNYDQQFEMAYARFTNRGIDDAYQALEIQCKHTNKNPHTKYNPKKFSIIKLNGSVGTFSSNNSNSSLLVNYRPTLDQNDGLDYKARITLNMNFVLHLVKQYHDVMLPFRLNHPHPVNDSLMSFAWEEEKFGKEHILGKAVTSCSGTNTLVVIGYSFPYFNREIDKMLFDNMRNVKKVYIQDKYPQDIEDRILTLMPPQANLGVKIKDVVNFVHITNVEQFVLPFEL